MVPCMCTYNYVVKEQLGCQFLLPALFKTGSFSFPALCIWDWLSFEILEAFLLIYFPVGVLGLQTLMLWCLPSRNFWDLNSGHQECTTTPYPLSNLRVHISTWLLGKLTGFASKWASILLFITNIIPGVQLTKNVTNGCHYYLMPHSSNYVILLRMLKPLGKLPDMKWLWHFLRSCVLSSAQRTAGEVKIQRCTDCQARSPRKI